MIATRNLKLLPSDGDGTFHALRLSHAGTPARPGTTHSQQGTRWLRCDTFAWWNPKGHSAPFSIYAAARDGFTGSRNAQTERASAMPAMDILRVVAARLIRSGNWQSRQSADDGEVRSWTLPSPVSGAPRRHPAQALVCQRPRGCATTTGRPESRRGPRIGAGWDPVARA
jgi:hypothetical protein